MDKKLHKLIKGTIRKEHFENGGTVAAWRGVANVYTDNKKKHNKKACRSKVEQDQEEL
jgi:hypothetical protein